MWSSLLDLVANTCFSNVLVNNTKSGMAGIQVVVAYYGCVYIYDVSCSVSSAHFVNNRWPFISN